MPRSGTATRGTARILTLQGTWLRIPLDGGPFGGEVDLELSAHDGETWHLSACVVVADELGPVSK
ncbi:hypothetical protein [Streptomyces sp. NPDC056982]|uniref:hypothetical protein n=1 Tax=Streptomyces sp. NPDC056982 TaxID=3345986 RepID=UPI00363F302F